MQVTIGFNACNISEGVVGFPDECWFIVKVEGMNPHATRKFYLNQDSKINYFLPKFLTSNDLMKDIKVKVTLCCFSEDRKEIIPFGVGQFTITKFLLNEPFVIDFKIKDINSMLQNIATVEGIAQLEEQKIYQISPQPKLCLNAYVF